MTKNISSNSFIIGHVLTIVFHVLIALAVLWTQYKNKAFFGVENRTVIIGLMILLLVASLLGLIPVLSHTEFNVS